jgi:hypothetical protein
MSRLSTIASRILAGQNSFAITVGTVSESAQINRHESYHFVFTRFFPGVTFDGMLHTVSLTYIYNALAVKRVYTAKKIGSKEPIVIFGYKV